MDPILRELLGYGVLGLVLVLAMIGWIEFKPIVDERKAREKTKDEIIAKLADAIERIADKIEARL
jgi:hypothetical protein